MPPSPKEMKLPKSGDEICVVTKTYRFIHPPKIGTMNESLKNIWLKVGFFSSGGGWGCKCKIWESHSKLCEFLQFRSWSLVFPTRGAIFIHICLMTSNSNWWFGNHWSSFFWNLWELPSEKKNVSSEYETRIPKSPSKHENQQLESEKPYPLGRSKNKSILPNSSWTFQPPPPTRTSNKNLNLPCCSRLWSSSSPPGTRCFPGKICGVASLQGTIRPQTLADCNHPAMKPASFLSSCRECFLFLWSFRSSGQRLEWCLRSRNILYSTHHVHI